MNVTKKSNREKMKKAYKRFSDAWRAEKAYQAWAIENGQELPKNTPKLGRRPTFSMWMTAVKNNVGSKQVTPDSTNCSKEEIPDLDWEDDTVAEKKESAPVCNGDTSS